jgi:3-oxoacyl-[acyl-carrier-protein] synthase III
MPTRLGPIDGVAIVGGGTAYPARTLSNEEVLRAVAPWALPGKTLDDERLAFLASGLEETLGVRERAWAHLPGTPLDHEREETTLDLAVRAAKAALDDAKVSAREVPLVICTTSTPHRMTSTISAALGSALGTQAACFDLRSGCSGGLFALATAALYLAAGIPRVLVVGTETFSKVLPKQSKIAAISLGDGAAAVLLERRDGAALLSAALSTDGALGGLVTTDGALPPTEAEIARGGYELSGAPDDLAAVIPHKYAEAIGAALDVARMTAGDISLFVPHQTSTPLVHAIAERAGIPAERTFLNVPRHANVGSAGMLGALVEARAEGRFAAGDHVLCAAVGGGMSWAAAVLRC